MSRICSLLEGLTSPTLRGYATNIGWAQKLRLLKIKTEAGHSQTIKNLCPFNANNGEICIVLHQFFWDFLRTAGARTGLPPCIHLYKRAYEVLLSPSSTGTVLKLPAETHTTPTSCGKEREVKQRQKS